MSRAGFKGVVFFLLGLWALLWEFLSFREDMYYITQSLIFLNVVILQSLLRMCPTKM